MDFQRSTYNFPFLLIVSSGKWHATSSLTSYESGPIDGRINALIFEGSEPYICSISLTHLPDISSIVPFHPEWAAARTFLLGSYIKTGTQSAVLITRTIPLIAVIRPSASPADGKSSEGSLTTWIIILPWTWSSMTMFLHSTPVIRLRICFSSDLISSWDLP